MGNKLLSTKLISLLSILIIIFTSCKDSQELGGTSSGEDVITPVVVEELPLEFVEDQGQQIRQWAFEAEASSEYANPDWAATQVTGEPDTERCGDYQTAWATASSDSIAWIEVRFPVAVHVTLVNVIESFNPNQVVKVELLGAFDRVFEVYNQAPNQVDQPCPYTLSIPIEQTEGRFDTIRITLDQSVLGLGWNQIDAVELIGTPE